MSAGADEKARRRAEREANERADAARSARRRRLGRLGAAVLVAAVVLIAAVALSRSGSDDSSQTPSDAADGGELARVSDTTTLLGGIPQKGSVLGNPKARVTLIEYADLQCPFCRQYALDVLPTLIERYVRPGRIKFDLRLIPILGPDSERAARAAIAASERGRYWQFADLFFHNQGLEGSGYATDEFVARIGSAVPGLDGRALVARSSSRAVDDRLKRFEAEASAARLDSTPTFQLVRGTDAPKPLTPEALEPASFVSEIDRLLGASGR